MLTDKRFWTLALVLSVCVLAAAGCRRKSDDDDDSDDDDIFTTDAFPGDAVQNGNVADDKRAMSNSGETINFGSLRVTFNGDRCEAMVTYATGSGLYAHHYRDGSWTPPVALRAIDQSFTDAAAQAADVIHAFINTSDHTSSAARERDGDCIIAYKANDTDDDGALTLDDINRNVYVTYFDVTFRDDISKGYGFGEFSRRISANDELGEDAVVLGMVTDGLCGEAWFFNGLNQYTYGDQTTAIEIVWAQLENNDAGVGVDDDVFHGVRFDPAETIAADLPLTPGADTRLGVNGYGASDSGTSSEETRVGTGYCRVYNNLLFYRVGCDNQTAGDDPVGTGLGAGAYFGVATNEDVALQYTAFDLATGAILTGNNLHFTSPSTGDLIENNGDFIYPGFTAGFIEKDIYGSDEGLSACVIFSRQLIADPDGDVDFGDLINDSRLVLTEISEISGLVLEDAVVDFEDIDITDHAINTSGGFSSRISRNGDYIWVAWHEVVDSGVTDETGAWAAQYLTTRIQSDGTYPIPDLLSNTLSNPINVNPDFDGQPVSWIEFQDCLGYVCGAQSDAQVMNLFYEQSTGLFDEIDAVELNADLIGTPVIPSAFFSLFEVYEDGDQVGAGLTARKFGFNFNATDSGEGGNYFGTYRDDVDGTATDDFRLFAERNGVGAGIAEIDSFVLHRQVPSQKLHLACTPKGANIGGFDPVNGYDGSAHNANTTIHVFFFEDATTEDSTNGDALRTRQFNTQDTAVSFGDNFVPNAGTTFVSPFDLGLPNLDPIGADQPLILGQNHIALAGGSFFEPAIQTSGDRVAIWFRELDRVYCQEFGGSGNGSSVGWLNINGVSDPWLVDDDLNEELSASNPVVHTRSCVCDKIDCASAFWSKTFKQGGTDQTRLQVRVRSGN